MARSIELVEAQASRQLLVSSEFLKQSYHNDAQCTRLRNIKTAFEKSPYRSYPMHEMLARDFGYAGYVSPCKPRDTLRSAGPSARGDICGQDETNHK